jgi:hypothetical protein
MPLANAKQVIETVGQQVISAEAIKTFRPASKGTSVFLFLLKLR